jgi:hypothetical protein
MSSDSRWTGGLANREWQRGTRTIAPIDRAYLAGQLSAYLRDCARFGLKPSEDTALKIVYRRGSSAADQIRAGYRKMIKGEKFFVS